MRRTLATAILNPTSWLTYTSPPGPSTWVIGFSSSVLPVLSLTHSLWTLPQSAICLICILSGLRQTFLAGRHGSDA